MVKQYNNLLLHNVLTQFSFHFITSSDLVYKLSLKSVGHRIQLKKHCTQVKFISNYDNLVVAYTLIVLENKTFIKRILIKMLLPKKNDIFTEVYNHALVSTIKSPNIIT